MITLRPEFALTEDIPFLALTGELWGIFREPFKEKRLRYIEKALYMKYKPAALFTI